LSTFLVWKKMSKNICLIVGSFNIGGLQRVVLSLAQVFSELGNKVVVIALSNDKKSSFPLDECKFSMYAIKKRRNPIRGIQDMENAKSLQNQIAEIGVDFDLVISNAFETNRICRKSNIPNMCYCFHGTVSAIVNEKTGFSRFRRKIQYLLLIKKLYKNQKLISVSDGVKQDLIKFGAHPEDIQTIYNPFDINDIKRQSKAYAIQEKDYIIHLGHFNSDKQHDILIKAYKKSGIKQKLLLLGDDSKGTGGQIKQLVIDLNLQNHVIFKGLISNPFPYVKNAKALILSSKNEGLPTVLIEALILNTPIVSTNCLSGPSEILINELKPFLSPVGDIEALAKNIKKMVNSPIEITNKYFDKFSAEKSARQYLSLTFNN